MLPGSRCLRWAVDSRRGQLTCAQEVGPPRRPRAIVGCWRLPEVLRQQGIVARLGANDGGRVQPPPYTPDHDATGTRNGLAIADYAVRLADRLGELLVAGGFPLLLGGDCSILLGAMLALRRRGPYGLAFVDGHLDFRHLGWAPAVGAVAGEDLAVVTGRAEPALADIDGLGPYVADADVVALGEREGDPGERAAIAETEIAVIDLSALRREGLRRPALPYWVHVDADVLDSDLLGAVDSPAPDGLAFDELAELLRELVA